MREGYEVTTLLPVDVLTEAVVRVPISNRFLFPTYIATYLLPWVAMLEYIANFGFEIGSVQRLVKG